MNPSPIIRSAEFVKSCVHPKHYPLSQLPEIAFAGRSNVGKSSLINCLVQRKKLVRTSRTPGRTQMINFFRINEEFLFVDLPGYGFARVPESVRSQWGPMVETYLGRRESLKGVVQIMDARHPPTPDDVQLWNWLSYHHIPAIPVLTKCDKIKQNQRKPSLQQASLILGVEPNRLILFSATTREGRQTLWDRLLVWLSNEGHQGPAPVPH